MSPARFLREHWQKKPLLVRGAFAGFRDPFTPEELAGLACEEGVESRIVRERSARRWDVTWGPHPEARFLEMPERKWTFLVQEVNRHVPESALLLEPFAFLPNVRVDDVMVSYAAPGGSVGPHLDSYDVFLVQGLGERRWKYGTKPAKDRRFVPGLDLRILERPVMDADHVLGPGDLLYLPPGFAHHGIAETPCLTYSVGFRAPSFGEMWKERARDEASRSARASELLVDPPLAPVANPGEIPRALLREVRRAVRAQSKTDDAIDRWFARFATRLAPDHVLAAPKRPLSAPEIARRLRKGAHVARSEEARYAFLPGPEGGLFLYVGGEEIAVPQAAAPLARAVCAARRFEPSTLAALAAKPAARDLLVTLFSRGALRFTS
ncbi:MAG: cupin domain-containing protein [Deltaproteobacteria bacterium]|nr:cupin domain-containing protein [Deltaproteobacteria bacterium]